MLTTSLDSAGYIETSSLILAHVSRDDNLSLCRMTLAECIWYHLTRSAAVDISIALAAVRTC